MVRVICLILARPKILAPRCHVCMQSIWPLTIRPYPHNSVFKHFYLKMDVFQFTSSKRFPSIYVFSGFCYPQQLCRDLSSATTCLFSKMSILKNLYVEGQPNPVINLCICMVLIANYMKIINLFSKLSTLEGCFKISVFGAFLIVLVHVHAERRPNHYKKCFLV